MRDGQTTSEDRATQLEALSLAIDELVCAELEFDWKYRETQYIQRSRQKCCKKCGI